MKQKLDIRQTVEQDLSGYVQQKLYREIIWMV